MKQKYTITVAGMDINIITDQAPETVESIVGTIDRRIREINLRSPRCSRTESALLCAMDYCADKLTLSERVKVLEAEIASLVKPEGASAASDAELESTKSQLAKTAAELEIVKSQLASAEGKLASSESAYLDIKSELEASNAENQILKTQLKQAEEKQSPAQNEELSSALDRIVLLESGADELAEDIKVKNQKLETLSAENAALRAELEELRTSRAVKAEKIAFFAEAGSEEAKSERPVVRRYLDKKPDAAEQITIDGEDIPQTDAPAVKKRERRLGAFDLLNSDDV